MSAVYVYDGDGTLVKSVVNATTTYHPAKTFQKQIKNGTTQEQK